MTSIAQLGDWLKRNRIAIVKEDGKWKAKKIQEEVVSSKKNKKN